MSKEEAFIDVANALVRELADRESRTGLRGLQEFLPVSFLDRYASLRGGGSHMAENITVPRRQLEELGLAYADMPSIDERILPSYRAMVEETQRQFDDLTLPRKRGGLGVDVSVSPTDPFDVTTEPGLRQMLDDLQQRRLAVLSTEATGGHPVMSNEQNDMFRAVHDAFGHAATGRGFGPHGEEAAFRAHSAMYPREALPALTAELRAQNAFLNQNGYFGPQKAAFVPERFMRDNPFDLTDEEKLAAWVDAVERMKRYGRF